MPTVPQVQFPGQNPIVTTPPVITSKPARQMSLEDRHLLQRLKDLNTEIRRLKHERTKIKRQISNRAVLAKTTGPIVPVKLYALRLEDGCWYIGMTYNVKLRFAKHCRGKGARWTALHQPIEIVETRTTEYFDQDAAARLEDDMTLEYAMKYGTDKVRGGGWCQTKPRWPDVVLQNESPFVR